jgi:hypothetical protein
MSSLGSFLKEAIAGIQVSTIKLQDALSLGFDMGLDFFGLAEQVTFLNILV